MKRKASTFEEFGYTKEDTTQSLSIQEALVQVCCHRDVLKSTSKNIRKAYEKGEDPDKIVLQFQYLTMSTEAFYERLHEMLLMLLKSDNVKKV